MAREECVRETLVLSLCFPLHWKPAHLANGIGCRIGDHMHPHTHTGERKKKRKIEDAET